MTPEQVGLVRSSFAEVAVLGRQAGALFYQNLFELDPSLRVLFKGDPAEQHATLLSSLALVVDALDRPAEMLPAVRALGRRHAHYGVRSEHYATVGRALIRTLEQGLGAGFTPAVRAAWLDAYGLLAWTMMAAAENELRGQAA